MKKVRIIYHSAASAEEAASKLPIKCNYKIVKEKNKDAYLEVDEEYKDYVMRYLNPNSI